MDYTIQETHLKLNQMCDKMGSDYFPLPLILNFFETATFDFVAAHLKRVEVTQTITDDIANLIITTDFPVINDPSKPIKFMAAIPVNYLRQVSYDVLYNDGTRCRRADLKRHSEYVMSLTNTNKKPTKDYPAIVQQSGLFMIDCGDAVVPTTFRLTYAKKPIFATTGQPTTRIVNLPDDTIEQIMKTTVTNLFSKTADERGQSAYQLEEAYRKTFR
jgi:hypothetical protein